MEQWNRFVAAIKASEELQERIEECEDAESLFRIAEEFGVAREIFEEEIQGILEDDAE